ncbi:hypothetical protein DPMN_143490 [Dreissena polymorpha]|uniref:Uncharacterized protein n=1 Tax=Dreissena polymorpha TaxID=45954 RepID=A0A9D4JJQ6_DREPO|nr:hypothetical protein DPMN_143490 [Dreissena polymorpha]
MQVIQELYRNASSSILLNGQQGRRTALGHQWASVLYLVNRLYERAQTYGMNVCTLRAKIMVKSTTNTSAFFTMNDDKLAVTSFKYLEASLSKDGISTAEVRITIAMVRLSRLCTSSSISFNTKYSL